MWELGDRPLKERKNRQTKTQLHSLFGLKLAIFLFHPPSARMACVNHIAPNWLSWCPFHWPLGLGDWVTQTGEDPPSDPSESQG